MLLQTRLPVRRFTACLAGAAVAATLTFTGPAGATAEYDSIGPAADLQELTDSPRYFEVTDGPVLRLYRAFFNRDADVAGARYWIDLHRGDTTLEDLAWGFSNSEEFTDRYGSDLSNSEFLTILYSNILGRTPDTAGFDYWLGEMNNGLGKDGVVRWITANAEFIDRYPYDPKLEWEPVDLFVSVGELQEVFGVSPLDRQVNDGVFRDPDPTDCLERFDLPGTSDERFTFGETDDAESFLYFQKYREFDSDEEAAAFIANGAGLQATCGRVFSGSLYIETQTPLDLTTVFTNGEFAVITTREFDPDDNGSVRIIAALRYGKIVIVNEMRGSDGTDMVLWFQKLLEYGQDRADQVAPDGD